MAVLAADALALPAGEVTLAQVLRTAGYRTGMIGKWHLGHKPGTLPTDRGFEEYYGIPYSNDMRPVQVLEGTQVAEYPVVQATLTQRYTERAVRFIQDNKARPFFLYLAHAMPHKPLAVSEQQYQKSGHGLYADVMTELDAGIGRVLQTLKDAGVDDNTLVIFHQRQRALVRRQHRRSARDERQLVGGRLSRAADRPLAGKDPRRSHQRPAGGDDGPVRHGAAGHRGEDAR